MWPDSFASLLAVYWIGVLCGFCSSPAAISFANYRQPSSPSGQVPDSSDRLSSKQRKTLLRNIIGGRCRSLTAWLEHAAAFCEGRRVLAARFSCASLLLTAVASVWMWTHVYAEPVSMFGALAHVVFAEVAGVLMGVALFQAVQAPTPSAAGNEGSFV